MLHELMKAWLWTKGPLNHIFVKKIVQKCKWYFNMFRKNTKHKICGLDGYVKKEWCKKWPLFQGFYD